MTEHRSEWINFEEEENKSQERIKAALDIKVTGDRLESIKERLNLYKASEESYYVDDVEYLLNEIARLKVITCPACGEKLQWME